MAISAADRESHRRWLVELTSIPTAAGHEERVIEWIRRWASERADLRLDEDHWGNLHIRREIARSESPPIYFTAHLDHPAFVVERVVAPSVVELAFRGGVLDQYFKDAPVVVHGDGEARVSGVLTGESGQAGPFKTYLAELGAGGRARVGSVATWDLPKAEIIDGIVHAPACDDLAALAAALAAYDELGRGTDGASARVQDVRLLFTRAEEVGFVGAIGACKAETMAHGSRVIALENSRSFDDSPINGGPIVRVGDRMSIFSPELTGAIAKRAEDIAGSAGAGWRWQRKLMAGGACEATVFCAAGYEATCLCLPLGNYHNMANLAAVQAGSPDAPAKIEREFIGLADFEGLVDLLVACGRSLPVAPPIRDRIEKLWADREFVLGR